MRSSSEGPQRDKRLLGVWKSNRKRTVSEWRFNSALSPKKRQQFLKIFGRLIITYTPRFRTWKMDEYRNRHQYTVLGKDWHSVAIKYVFPVTAEDLIEYIVFEGEDSYYVIMGKNREWFKRVKGKRALLRRAA
jgi:hypothetical protein